MIEYRVGWETNMQGGSGVTEWITWEGPEETPEAVQEALNQGGPVPRGMEEAVEASGFGWSTEVRTVTALTDEETPSV